MAERVDLVVVGSGPAGYTGAIRAAQLGMRVVCVEKDVPLGGTCLNVGCIPSKALLDSSEHYHLARNGLGVHGVRVGDVALDLPAMMARKQKVVRGLTQGIAGLFRKNKVTRLTGTGRLAAPDRVVVTGADGETVVETAHVLIATGSEPIALPGLPFDGERVVSSTEALALESVPARLLVIGAGAVGLELGSVWRRLGSEVLVVEFLDRIVPGIDAEIATTFKVTPAEAQTKLIALSKVPQSDLLFLSEHGKDVATAATNAPGQWKTWWWVCVGGEILFLPFIFVMTGRWSPRKAKQDADEHEAKVQAELAALQKADA